MTCFRPPQVSEITRKQTEELDPGVGRGHLALAGDGGGGAAASVTSVTSQGGSVTRAGPLTPRGSLQGPSALSPRGGGGAGVATAGGAWPVASPAQRPRVGGGGGVRSGARSAAPPLSEKGGGGGSMEFITPKRVYSGIGENILWQVPFVVAPVLALLVAFMAWGVDYALQACPAIHCCTPTVMKNKLVTAFH